MEDEEFVAILTFRSQGTDKGVHSNIALSHIVTHHSEEAPSAEEIAKLPAAFRLAFDLVEALNKLPRQGQGDDEEDDTPDQEAIDEVTKLLSKFDGDGTIH